MSKVFKGVAKVFKKVIKVVKKVAPIILAAAAIYFTAGAALGLPGASMGLTGAVSAVTGGLGQGVLGGVVRGAIVSAAKGAAIGGTVSAATGGSFSQGAQAGAAVGAVTGGITGGFNARAGIPGGGSKQPPAGTTPGIGDNTGAGTVGQGPGLDEVRGMIPATPRPGLDEVRTMIPGVEQSTSADAGFGSKVAGGLKQVGGFIKDNKDLVGPAIIGIGQGLIAGSEYDAYRDAQRDRFSLTAANYEGTDPGRNFRSLSRGTSGETPTDRYDPQSYGSFTYEYDPAQRKIIKVPAR